MVKGSPWNGFSIYWLCWLGIGFLVPEMWALITGRPQDTLSAQVWNLTGQGTTNGWNFAHFVVAAFCVWLLGHFVFGWWR